jgi:glycosyltransferase involved in cell wall biosynthesis
LPKLRWAVITGEYPPDRGGVGDYTRLVARGLAEAGDEVHVWAPIPLHVAPKDAGVNVHELPGHFSLESLVSLSKDLRCLPRPYHLLVQYVPHAFGWKAMNVPFCWWISRRPEPVWIMFHEVAFPISRHQPLAHNFLGMVNRLMVRLLTRQAERILITIPAWESLLPKIPSVRRRVAWLPVPSNIPSVVSPEQVANTRRHFASPNEIVIGHFGTYGHHIAPILRRLLPPLLAKQSGRRALLMGNGSDCFAALLRKENPALRGQMSATGSLGPEQTALHLAACDCLLQPFADGVSSRRTSVMAGLALGLPIVTNSGPLTDLVWTNTDSVFLVPSPSPSCLLDAMESLLAAPQQMTALRRSAANFYRGNFALSRTIDVLRSGHASRGIAP